MPPSSGPQLQMYLAWPWQHVGIEVRLWATNVPGHGVRAVVILACLHAAVLP